MVLHNGVEVGLVDFLMQFIQTNHDEILGGATLKLQTSSVIKAHERITSLPSPTAARSLKDKDLRKKLLALEKFFQKVPALRIYVPKRFASFSFFFFTSNPPPPQYSLSSLLASGFRGLR